MTTAPVSRVDLHCHSTASDGALTPAEIVARAAEAGVEQLALTDHDTLAGVGEAAAAARAAGMALIPGVELSVRWQQHPLHLVGLGIDVAAPALLAGLAELQRQRRERTLAIGAKLERFGVRDATARAIDAARGGQVTRTHFATLLVEDGVCRDFNRAFKQLLGAGRPGYVGADWVPLTDAINWIHAAGGVAVLAHPHQYRLGSSTRERLLAAFRDAGGDALEVCCGGSRPHEIDAAADAARRFGLRGSVGSDFHNPSQSWRALGRLAPLPHDIAPVWAQLPLYA